MKHDIKTIKIMNKSLFVLLLVFCSLRLSAQTELKDSGTMLPVTNAMVYDSCGTVIGHSDDRGVIRLKNVNVESKRKKYYHFRVYYRTVEDVNSTLKYYNEGIADFLVTTKNGKAKRVRSYSSLFASDSLLALDIRRSFEVSDMHVGTPYFHSKPRRTTIDSTGNVMLANHVIGSFVKREDAHEVIYSVDELYPKASIVLNLFGYHQVLDKFNSTTVFHDTGLGKHSIYDIKAFNEYRHLTLKHKKEAVTKDIDVNDYVYVIASEFSDDKKGNSFPKVTKAMIDEYRNKYPLEPVVLEQLPKLSPKDRTKI